VSEPYFSVRDGKKRISLSAPVYFPPADQVASLVAKAAPATAFAPLLAAASLSTQKPAAVLLATIEMQDFHKWLRQAWTEKGHAVVLAADGTPLFHSQEYDLTESPEPAKSLMQTTSSPELAKLVCWARGASAGQTVLTNADHRDPLLSGDVRFLAAFSPILDGNENQFEWLAIVQLEHKFVIKPFEDSRKSMTVWGLTILATACLLLLGMWTWLLTKLRRREKAVHA
jgi:hypothetical protein